MAILRQEFTIHPVGQGFFYSGVVSMDLNDKSKEFRFVFDCGSFTKDCGEDEVEFFKQTNFDNDEDRLDLLVLSHFDGDHVNHVKRLLAENRKINSLVLPFFSFSERLYLTLSYLENRNAPPNNDDIATINMMLDPIGTLGNNLDNNSTVYFVDASSDNYNDSPNESNDGDSVPSDLPQDWGFDFDGESNELSDDERHQFLYTIKPETAVKFLKVNDSIPGVLHLRNMRYIRLMEFLFYRRKLNGNEEAFFNAVFLLFCNHFGIDPKLPDSELLKQMLHHVKTVNNASLVKDLFNEAKKTYPVGVIGRDVVNQNTTALSMLHRNLRSAKQLFSPNDRNDFPWTSIEISRIIKFDGKSDTRVTENSFLQGLGFTPVIWRESVNARFPNILLSSDSFILNTNEVDAFYNRYKSYWDQFWLFQIPHHGSKNNSDIELFSRLPKSLAKFINFGTKHHFDCFYSHPNVDVINDLKATNQAERLFAVNEFSGVSFIYHLIK